MDKPLVSVVIATYNMSDYLPLAIKSALAQTYENIEVLVVDDGSTDGTAEVVQPLLADPRLKYRMQENSGQAVAKNHGIRESKGQYVAFLDADDLWVPDKLEQQMPLFHGSAAVGVVYSRLAYIDENGKELRIADNELFRGRVSGPMLIRNFIGFSTSVVRRECLDRLGGFDEAIRMGIDYDLWLRISTEYEFDFVERPLLYYREWSGQMSNNCKGRYRNGIAIMEKFLQKFPSAVDKRTEKEAWAHTYVGYGQCMHRTDGHIGSALRYYARALSFNLMYVPAWKAIVKTALRLPQ